MMSHQTSLATNRVGLLFGDQSARPENPISSIRLSNLIQRNMLRVIRLTIQATRLAHRSAKMRITSPGRKLATPNRTRRAPSPSALLMCSHMEVPLSCWLVQGLNRSGQRHLEMRYGFSDSKARQRASTRCSASSGRASRISVANAATQAK